MSIASVKADTLLLTAVICYFIGNIQSSVIISKLFFKDDIRTHESGNAGATNMLRVYGKLPGITTFLIDFAKGAAAAAIGRALCGADCGGYVGTLFTVIGHCWPVLCEFRGGKGVSASFGGAWLMLPKGAIITTVACIILILTTRMVSLMALAGFIVFLATMLFFRCDTASIIAAACMCAIVFYRHRSNIKRIIKGEERKVK